MPRRKSAPVNAPSTLAQATELLGEYANKSASVEQIRAEYSAMIAALQAERDNIIAPVETGLKEHFIALRSWWAVSGDAVTDGKRKTAEIAGCLVGIRTTPPSLKLPKGAVDGDMIERLYDEHEEFIVTTHKLNKSALIAALRVPDGAVAAALETDFGLTTSQREEFFIDRVKTEPAPIDPAIMPAEVVLAGAEA